MSDQPPATIEAFSELSHYELHPPSIKRLDEKLCRRHHLVVLGRLVSGAPAIVGMLNPSSRRLRGALEQLLGRSVETVRLNAYEVHEALDRGYGIDKDAQSHKRLHLRPLSAIEFHQEKEPRRVLSDVLSYAITLGASDIHIETYETDIDVRFRIDGLLQQMNTEVSRANVAAVVSTLKVLAELDIAEQRESQDGRVYGLFVDGDEARSVDFRLSVIPGLHGEEAVLRSLDESKGGVELSDLNISPEIFEPLKHILHNPEGLFLVTGPTGSGKSTTLYAALREINSPHNKILTVEDPVEFMVPKVNQKQVNSKMAFADYIRAFLRQDPDVILVGEIRDEETAKMAVRASQTGHMVLSTLHTNDAVGAVSRLNLLGVPRRLIGDVFLGSLSQRLIRRVCPDCAEQDNEPSSYIAQKVFAQLGVRFPLLRGRGCARCHETGYRGRVAIFEAFLPSNALVEMISRETSGVELRGAAREDGMRTLLEDGVAKIFKGLSTFEEIARVVPYSILQEPLNPNLLDRLSTS